MKRSKRFAIVAAVAAVAAAVALTGCSSDGNTDAPESDAAATTTLNAAADSAAALTGAAVVLDIEGSLQGVNASKVEADVATKPKVVGEGTATLTMGDKSVSAPFVYVDDHMYANVDDKGYLDYGDGRSIYDVSKILDADKGVPFVLRSIEGAKEDGTENIDGVETTKITGTVPAKDLSGLTGASPEAKGLDSTIPVTVWITKDGENNVARVLAQPAEGASMTITLSDWGKTVTAEKPADVKSPSVKPTTAPKSGEPTRQPVG
ncbi:LppX_LprAFG lipoprotein [Gordonia hydrophobica]|uniref:LppX_LprAFG lipoprotein n=1 Tax=Gordonia hydrophobica TaxID=40516 RepID=A0ABZ2U1N2_9ACTN|nr:LppX_LprAFG lipoprotein [Gordonia hydrophobica]MBM7368562.1 lipoprotein LprA [Gordonia hydrophobica]